MAQVDEALVTNVLGLLAQRTRLTKTAAHKLCYLIDVVAIKETGEPVLRLRFRHTDYGMWSPDLADILTAAKERGKLQAKRVRADVGQGSVFAVSPDFEPRVSSSLRSVVSDTLKKFGGLPLSRLIVAAKATSPFIYSKEGEWVDWEMAIEERCERNHTVTPETANELQTAERAIRQGKGRHLPYAEALTELE